MTNIRLGILGRFKVSVTDENVAPSSDFILLEDAIYNIMESSRLKLVKTYSVCC